jgi:hypothetical protein
MLPTFVSGVSAYAYPKTVSSNLRFGVHLEPHPKAARYWVEVPAREDSRTPIEGYSNTHGDQYQFVKKGHGLYYELDPEAVPEPATPSNPHIGLPNPFIIGTHRRTTLKQLAKEEAPLVAAEQDDAQAAADEEERRQHEDYKRRVQAEAAKIMAKQPQAHPVKGTVVDSYYKDGGRHKIIDVVADGKGGVKHVERKKTQ